MSIPDKVTLMLFSNSAGLCNFCKSPLVEQHFDGISNLGERAHINGKRKGSARYIDQNSNNNSYSNLILLCAKHHKIIDDHPNQYPANTLFTIKSDHEMRVRQNPLMQCNADVALILSIFSIYNMMDLLQIINYQNPNNLCLDVLHILDIENSLEDYYEGDYPFKHPELQAKTKLMFYYLRELSRIFHNEDVFNIVQIHHQTYFQIIANDEHCESKANAWHYFDLFRGAFNEWYQFCKMNYGV